MRSLILPVWVCALAVASCSNVDGPGPKVSLTATPEAVATGTRAELSWEVSDASSCEATEGWSGERGSEGGSEERFVYENTTFELTCTGPDGSASDAVEVAINTSQLLISVNLSRYFVLADERFTADFTVSNPGSATVQAVVIFVTIPDLVDVDPNDLPPNAVCVDEICEPGQRIEWTVGDLGAGEAATLSLNPVVASEITTDEEIPFRALATAAEQPDENVTETATEGRRTLALGLAQDPNRPKAGDAVVYTLEYENPGVDALDDVDLMLALPEQVELSDTTGDPTVDEEGLVTWSLGELPPDEKGTVEATVAVDPDLPPGAQLRAIATATVGGMGIRALAKSVALVGDGSVSCLDEENDAPCDLGPGNGICLDGTCVVSIVNVSSFASGASGSVCALGYDHTTDTVWTYQCAGTTIDSFLRDGTPQLTVPAPVGGTDDVDIDFAAAPFTLAEAAVAEGGLLFTDGNSGVAEVYAVDKAGVDDPSQLTTEFGDSHVVGGAFHASRGTLLLVQDSQPGGGNGNLAGEVDPVTGEVSDTFPLVPNFSVFYGDADVCQATGNLLVVSSSESTIAEFAPEGVFLGEYALPPGVSGLSGIGMDDATGEAWVGALGGTIWQLSGLPCGPMQ